MNPSFVSHSNSSLSRPRWKVLTQSILLFAGVIFVGGCGVIKEKPFVGDGDDAPYDPQKFVRYQEPGDYPQSWELEDGRRLSFSISLPPSLNNGKELPLILALHEGVNRVPPFYGAIIMKGMVKPALGDMEAIIVAPDAFKSKIWTNFRCEEVVMILMKKICEEYPIDRKRILVVGYGMGAKGAWNLAGKYPEFFTGAIPIAGAPVDNYAEIDWTVPMLVVHSKADELYPFKHCEAAVNSITQRGGSTQFYPLEEFSHYEDQKYIDPLKEAFAWFKNDVWAEKAIEPESAEGKGEGR